MSYSEKVKWEITPTNLPYVRKNCSKCGEKTRFINTEKFRVNANGNHIDIWMIYQCETCKTSYKLTMYERIKPTDLEHELLDRLTNNDRDMVTRFAFDVPLHQKNKAEIVFDTIEYGICSHLLERREGPENQLEVTIHCPYALGIPMTKILSNQLNLSRSVIKAYIEQGKIKTIDGSKLEKLKVKEGLRVIISDLE